MVFCEFCAAFLPTPAGVGRPAKYCSTKCRQAAHRVRSNGTRRAPQRAPRRKTSYPAPPNAQLPDNTTPGRLDDILREVVRDLQDDARVLLGQLAGEEPEEFLRQAQQMRKRLDCLIAGLVGQARLRHVTWSRIGQALAISEDTARHRYTDDYVLRRLREVSRLCSVPASLRALYSEPPTSNSVAAVDHGGLPSEAEAAGPAFNKLASVLSMLARASELPLQDLARRSGCSPSYLSRILSGQRVPSWKITDGLARACGADPAILRKVWEREQLRRRPLRGSGDTSSEIDSLAGVSNRAQAVQRLLTALRTLHVQAGQPTPQQICVASKWRLNALQITAILDGNETCDWPTLLRLLNVLGGSPDYFHPLWQAATEQAPSPTAPAQGRPDLSSQPVNVRPTSGGTKGR